MTGQLLTADQLANRWQVPTSHVYRLAREGRIPCIELGRYRRFNLASVERFERSFDRDYNPTEAAVDVACRSE